MVRSGSQGMAGLCSVRLGYVWIGSLGRECSGVPWSRWERMVLAGEVMDSILQEDKVCYVTGYGGDLDKHHVYHGPRRKAADKWGCWVWLRHDIHMDLHSRNTELDRRLKRECQEAFESRWGHRKFMEIFGKSYL